MKPFQRILAMKIQNKKKEWKKFIAKTTNKNRVRKTAIDVIFLWQKMSLMENLPFYCR